MRAALACSLFAAACAAPGMACAQAPVVQGFLDLRVAGTDARDDSWLDGGLGKMRFGDGDDGVTGAGALALDWQATPSLLASTEVQYVPSARRPLDVIDAWVRYRPVSTTPWRASVKAGMFFPPISLENGGIGWTSTWTLTPSALNTWVGEELRTFGAEGRLEHRGRFGTLSLSGALFAKNDPAGELLATRGWALHDVVSGLDGSVREPDVLAPVVGRDPPVRYRPFLEMDHHVGAYAAVDWQTPAQDRLTALVYDNRADPTAEVDYAGRELYAWHTRFWHIGGEHRMGDVVLLAQAMRGNTAFEPAPGFRLDTAFAAGYVLAGWEWGAWQPAVRFDLFQARQRPDTLPAALNEHGNAIVLALNWRPHQALRVSGEVLRVDSARDQRVQDGLASRQRELQVQGSVRWFF